MGCNLVENIILLGMVEFVLYFIGDKLQSFGRVSEGCICL